MRDSCRLYYNIGPTFEIYIYVYIYTKSDQYFVYILGGKWTDVELY